MDDYVGRFDLWKKDEEGKKEEEEEKNFEKKRKGKKKSSPPKIHHHHLLVRTHHERGTRTRSLLLSLERVARSLFLGFSTRGNAPFFSLFFSRATHTARFRASEKAVVGRLPAQKEQKKQPSSHRSVCLRVKSSRRRGHARRVWATRLERNARNECARTRFYRDRFRRSSRNGWVPASVEASSS